MVVTLHQVILVWELSYAIGLSLRALMMVQIQCNPGVHVSVGALAGFIGHSIIQEGGGEKHW